MKLKIDKEVIAGMFISSGIIFVIVIIFVLGAKTGFGEAKYYQEVIFSDVGGLRIGAPVRLAGVDVGTVVDIAFLKDPAVGNKQVKVSLGILKKFRQDVERCTAYTIKTEGLLGDKLVDIELPQTQGATVVVRQGNYIIGHDPLDIKNLADDFSDTTRYFTDLTKRMIAVTDDLQGFTRSSKRLLERVEDRLIEGNLFNIFGEQKSQQ
ncbi:MAG: MlaD family protein [Candidatus Omnitrophota bacterium]